MNKFIGLSVISLCAFLNLSLIPISTIKPPTFTTSTIDSVEIVMASIPVPSLKQENLDSCKYWEFLRALGERESLNNYACNTNPYYKGKYQFGKATRETIGYGKMSVNRFLHSPIDQEKAMLKLLKLHEYQVQDLIDTYSGKYVHGVYITKSGILAGAHLAGANGVRRFFSRGQEFKDFKDWNKTKTSDYIRLFGGFDFDLDKIEIDSASIAQLN